LKVSQAPCHDDVGVPEEHAACESTFFNDAAPATRAALKELTVATTNKSNNVTKKRDTKRR
jgi:hypothetical protein